MKRDDPLIMQCGRYELTRHEVAMRLGVSVSTVRRLEFVRLHPVFDGAGTWRFDPAEVDALPRSPQRRRKASRHHRSAAGQRAARVFALFERGADLTYIVTTLKLEPRLVRRLHGEWARGLSAQQCGSAATRS